MGAFVMKSIFYFFKHMPDMSISFRFFAPHCRTFLYQSLDSVGSMKYSEINETYSLNSVFWGVRLCVLPRLGGYC